MQQSSLQQVARWMVPVRFPCSSRSLLSHHLLASTKVTTCMPCSAELKRHSCSQRPQSTHQSVCSRDPWPEAGLQPCQGEWHICNSCFRNAGSACVHSVFIMAANLHQGVSKLQGSSSLESSQSENASCCKALEFIKALYLWCPAYIALSEGKCCSILMTAGRFT